MSYVDTPSYSPHLVRVRTMMALIALGLGVILSRLWYLQIAEGEDLRHASEVNRTRMIRRVPPRGRIEDSSGKVLAANREQIVVSVIPAEARKNPGMLDVLASLIDESPDDLAAMVFRASSGMYDPVRVAQDIDLATATRIEERRLDLPGVTVGPEPERVYSHGLPFGHVLGQMGQISPNELRARMDEGYKQGDRCGKLGLERAYDSTLRGHDGGREVEVDASGRLTRQVGSIEPIAGSTLRLTLDSDLQTMTYEELSKWAARGDPGAAVALDPNTGAVLALVSAPSFDPNLFASGISRADWKKLQSDPLRPQINRAISSSYAPGSTFKVITTAAGLETNAVTGSSTDFCSGSIKLGRWTKHCHKLSGHGRVDLNNAIALSCDVFFYHLGLKLGPETMARYSTMFGLGTPSGIDLSPPGKSRAESTGVVPDPAWKLAHRHEGWFSGDTVDYAIGQSMLKCTPLQMCNVAAAIANGGTIYRPQIVGSIVAYDAQNHPRVAHTLRPEVLRQIGISKASLARIVRGMRSVMERGGTAAHAAIPGISIAGKTGTAQMLRKTEMVNNAWFIGFAPVDKPRIAVCVFVEGGGHGGDTAAPIARKMIAQYLHVTVNDIGVVETTD